MIALVFAAGLGTRLRPLTDKIPKALVPVGGVPVLGRVIGKLRNAGMGPVVVNACYLADKIVDYVSSQDFGVPVIVSVEPGQQPLETGGGIRHAREHLHGRFLMHNADILSNADLQAFAAADNETDLGSLLVSDRESDRYLLFDDDMRLVGWTNARTGELRSPFPSLDPDKCHRYAFCGIHILSDRVFPMMAAWPERFGIIDFYLSICDSQVIRGIVAGDLKLVDIGSPETLAMAEAAVKEDSQLF